MSTRITRGREPGKPKNVVGERVRVARLALTPEVTQQDLAGRLAGVGVTLDRSALARIEQGDRYVLDFELVALARALKTTTSFLLGEEVARPRK